MTETIRTDATSALIQGIVTSVGSGAFELEEVRSRQWACSTFSGARHDLTFTLKGDGAEAAAKRFAEAAEGIELDLAEHLLADLAVISTESLTNGARLRVEALTVDDPH